MTTLFDHRALLYTSTAQYVSAVLAYIDAARAAGRPVLVVVPAPRLELIRAARGRDDGHVTFLDMTTAGRNPGQIIPAVLGFCGAHPGSRPAIVGEPLWPGRTEPEHAACAVHEALLNAAFASVAGGALCAYDTSTVPTRWLRDARRTHPTVVDGEDPRLSPVHSADYDPAAVIDSHNQPLSAPSDSITIHYAVAADLRTLRGAAVEAATSAGIQRDRIAALEVVLSELAGNTLRHTGGGGVLHLWTEPDAVVSQITDGGDLTDALAGRIPVPVGQVGGRGLLLTNELSDLVRTFRAPGHTATRVWMRR